MRPYILTLILLLRAATPLQAQMRNYGYSEGLTTGEVTQIVELTNGQILVKLQLVRRREFRASPLPDGQSVQAAILRALWSFDAGRYLVVVARFPLSLSV